MALYAGATYNMRSAQMAQKTATSNPIANFYEAQTIATAEIARAALDGLQRLQKLRAAPQRGRQTFPTARELRAVSGLE